MAAGAAASAGTIASSNGNEIAAPIPRNSVRRGSAILVMIISLASYIKLLTPSRGRLGLHGPAHLERRAVDDPGHERGEPIVLRRRGAHDRAHHRLIRRLEA